MAKMKIEFNYQWRAHGLPLKDRAIAFLPRWAYWAARMPWLANLRDSVPGAAGLTERLTGLSARRSLPRWRHDTFLRTCREVGDVATADVILFVDTFTNYFEPENGRAALAVLKAAGYKVAVAHAASNDDEPARPLCCGRTFLASGLVDEAKREARRMVMALAPHVERGAWVAGLEPSCLLSLRDEFRVMGLGDRAQRLGERALLIEISGARAMGGRLRLPLVRCGNARVAYRHCHQKAFDAVVPHGKPAAHSRLPGRGRFGAAWPGAGYEAALRRLDAHGRADCPQCDKPIPRRSSLPKARAAGTRSSMARGGRRSTLYECSLALLARRSRRCGTTPAVIDWQ
jgi:hypothetical protein